MVTAFFTDSITTDNSSISVAGLSKDTKPGTYALAKSGSDYTLAGNHLLQSGSNYTSGSGDTNGLTLTISDTSITSANIYYGESLLSKMYDPMAELLTYNGDIENRLTNLRDVLNEIPDRQAKLDQRIAKLLQIDMQCNTHLWKGL